MNNTIPDYEIISLKEERKKLYKQRRVIVKVKIETELEALIDSYDGIFVSWNEAYKSKKDLDDLLYTEISDKVLKSLPDLNKAVKDYTIEIKDFEKKIRCVAKTYGMKPGELWLKIM